VLHQCLRRGMSVSGMSAAARIAGKLGRDCSGRERLGAGLRSDGGAVMYAAHC
jgi:hypothetical protein